MKLFIVISLTALVVQLSLSKVAGAMLVIATNGGKVKGIIKLLAPSYIVLVTAIFDFPHWFYGNNSMALRNSRNSLCV
ncbi:DUF2642 domain-containing protein [Veillonella sp.]|uniref:DUF2642 domain-containing protein n=1 Tax=Veillonella sp. TaxID=1926307 RepID=UPI003967BD6F